VAVVQRRQQIAHASRVLGLQPARILEDVAFVDREVEQIGRRAQ